MILQKTIDDVKERVDIVEVISDFVQLKKAGRNYKALSPFTDEKTPSFFVSPSKGIFKCFSTGKGGDAINFVMDYDGLNYIEAIKYLANKYGIEILESEQTQEEKLAHTERESLFIILNFAAAYFKDQLLNTSEGKSVGYGYFKERGFNETIIEKFDLGYSQEVWDGFYVAAKKAGYNEDLLEKAGLIIKKESKTYDRFRGRVMFPIHNVTGKVIAFGARTLKSDKSVPKYVNSPETEIYHKSHILYGIFQAKQAIRHEDNCFLVEGYTDVISLYQLGIHNVVASSGTSLTDEQIKLISRYTENVTVLFDGDKAGIKASLRGIDMILEKGLNVRAVVFPDGEDPDSYSTKLGATEFKKFLSEGSKDFISFKVSLYAEEAGKDPIKKAESIKEIVASIVKIPDPVKRAVYIKETARLLDMEERVLLTEQNKLLIGEKRKKESKQDYVEPLPYENIEDVVKQREGISLDDIIISQERECLRLLVNYGNEEAEEGLKWYHYYFSETQEDIEYLDPLVGEIVDLYVDALENGKIVDHEYFISNGSTDVKNIAADFYFQKYHISENWGLKFDILVLEEQEMLSKVFQRNLNLLKYRKIQKKVEEELKRLNEAKDEQESMKILEYYTEFKKYEIDLAKKLGITIGK